MVLPGNGHVRGSVLVVDDERTIADLVARYLEHAGYAALVARDGERALELAGEERPDLIVLDLMLPRIDGLEVMRRLRQRSEREHHRPPAVILLTAKGEETDRVVGLRLGADDYVVKPFSPRELVARVDAVLRRAAPAEAEPPEPIAAGEVVIEPAARRVLRGGEEVALTQREFDLLLFLARHPGRVFSREELMDVVWHYSFYTDTSTVTVHIRRLRAKLEATPEEPALLQTVWGVGYRFAP